MMRKRRRPLRCPVPQAAALGALISWRGNAAQPMKKTAAYSGRCCLDRIDRHSVGYREARLARGVTLLRYRSAPSESDLDAIDRLAHELAEELIGELAQEVALD